MDGLFLACLMGICGMPMSPAAEPLVALSAAPGAPAPDSAPAAPGMAALATTVSIAPAAPTVERPVERPVPMTSESDGVAATAPDGVTAASPPKASRAAIGDVVRRHATAVRNCYEKGLADDPTFSGTIEVAWRIQVDGKVSSATIVGGTQRNAVIEGCLLAEIPRWAFAPTTEPTVVGTFPFVLDATTLSRHAAPPTPKGSSVPARRAR